MFMTHVLFVHFPDIFITQSPDMHQIEAEFEYVCVGYSMQICTRFNCTTALIRLIMRGKLGSDEDNEAKSMEINEKH